MEFGFTSVHLIYLLAALSGIMLAEAVYLLYSGKNEKRAALNRRLRMQESKLSNEQVLIQLRKERGVSKSGFSLNGPELRWLDSCNAFAMSSLPVPLSPSISTVLLLLEMGGIISKTFAMAGLLVTISSSP